MYNPFDCSGLERELLGVMKAGHRIETDQLELIFRESEFGWE